MELAIPLEDHRSLPLPSVGIVVKSGLFSFTQQQVFDGTGTALESDSDVQANPGRP